MDRKELAAATTFAFAGLWGRHDTNLDTITLPRRVVKAFLDLLINILGSFDESLGQKKRNEY